MHSGDGGGGINENSARLRNPRKFVFHPWTAVAHFVPWLAQPEAIGKAGEISLGFSYLSDLPLPLSNGKQMFPMITMAEGFSPLRQIPSGQ